MTRKQSKIFLWRENNPHFCSASLEDSCKSGPLPTQAFQKNDEANLSPIGQAFLFRAFTARFPLTVYLPPLCLCRYKELIHDH